MTGELAVPYLIYRGRRIVGFDPDALSEVAQAYHAS